MMIPRRRRATRCIFTRFAAEQLEQRQLFAANNFAPAFDPPSDFLVGRQHAKSIDGIGDVNGDGISDLVTGSPRASGSGVATVVSGADGQILFRVAGGESDRRIGHSVSRAGDVNADGIPDLIVGGPVDPNGDGGVALVVSGEDGSILYRFVGGQADDLFGWSVASAGDVNGDGYADVIVGAPDTDSEYQKNAGRATVFSGEDGSILHDWHPAFNSMLVGYSVGAAGDVNGDGLADFMIGSPGTPTTFPDDPRIDFAPASGGEVTIISGADGRRLRTLSAGSAATTLFGASVGLLEDMDGDGISDHVVGSSRTAFVHSGATGQPILKFGGERPENPFQLGSDSRNPANALAVADAGDVNGDGRSDVIVGAPHSQVNGPQSGLAIVFSGETGTELYRFDISGPGNGLGGHVSSAGDVNGDGLADVFVGSRGTARAQLLISEPPITAFEVKTIDVTQVVDGYTVSDFVPRWVSDRNGDAIGVAVVGVHGLGTWQYSTDGGQTFHDIASASDASALLLRDTDLIRYVGNGEDGERATVELLAWDQTEGEAGQRMDATVRGGTTPFSLVAVTGIQTVRPVNDQLIVNVDGSVRTGDDTPTSPFANVTVTDGTHPNGERTVIVENRNPEYGDFLEESFGTMWSRWPNGKLTATGSPDEIAQALGELSFVPTENLKPAGAEYLVSFFINVIDSKGALASEKATLVITSVEDLPVLSVPSEIVTPFSVDFGTGSPFLPFSIDVDDADPAAQLTVELTVSHGQLSFAFERDLLFAFDSFVEAPENTPAPSNRQVLTGTVDEIQFFLEFLHYMPEIGFLGTDEMRVTASDEVGGMAQSVTEITVIPRPGEVELVDGILYVTPDRDRSEQPGQQINLLEVPDQQVDLNITNDFITVVMGDTEERFRRDQVERIVVGGSHWRDTSVLIRGTDADDVFEIWAKTGLATLGDLEFQLLNTTSWRIDGGSGRDKAVIHDTSGNDRFEAYPGFARMQGDGYVGVVDDVESVRAIATTGDDRARFHDSRGDDRLLGTPESAILSGGGFDMTAVGFDRVFAFATGGDDRAFLYDSSGDDGYLGTALFGRLGGKDFYNYAQNFDRVVAFASEGNDYARLEGAPGANTFVGSPTASRLSGRVPDFDLGPLSGREHYHRVEAFGRVEVNASGSGNRAILTGSDGDDVLFVNERPSVTIPSTVVGPDGPVRIPIVVEERVNVRRLSGDGFRITLTSGFDAVSVFGGGGHDEAELRTPGVGERSSFLGQYDQSRLWADDWYVTVNGFEHVDAEANVINVRPTFGTESISRRCLGVGFFAISVSDPEHGYSINARAAGFFTADLIPFSCDENGDPPDPVGEFIVFPPDIEGSQFDLTTTAE